MSSNLQPSTTTIFGLPTANKKKQKNTIIDLCSSHWLDVGTGLDSYSTKEFYLNLMKKASLKINNKQQNKANTNSRIGAILVPHANPIYSGLPATLGYLSVAMTRQPTTIIIISTLHQTPTNGLNTQPILPPRGLLGFKTQLGQILINTTVLDIFANNLNLAQQPFKDTQSLFEQEHSYQTQLPIIQTVFPDARVLPILIPANIQITHDMLAFFSDLLPDPDVLLAFNTDMSHTGGSFDYHPHTYGELVQHDLQMLKGLGKSTNGIQMQLQSYLLKTQGSMKTQKKKTSKGSRTIRGQSGMLSMSNTVDTGQITQAPPVLNKGGLAPPVLNKGGLAPPVLNVTPILHPHLVGLKFSVNGIQSVEPSYCGVGVIRLLRELISGARQSVSLVPKLLLYYHSHSADVSQLGDWLRHPSGANSANFRRGEQTVGYISLAFYFD